MKRNRISYIQNELEPLRKSLTEHRLYKCLKTVDDIRVFMESHVFAVWDFMSLLKALQQQLTCTQVPWQPAKKARLSRFVNEIVWGEESDVNEVGEPLSHFEMYLDAMVEMGSNVSDIETMLGKFNDLSTVQEDLYRANLTEAQREFLQFTFRIIQTNEPHKIAAAFTFGREDVIPDMFLALLNDMENKKGGDYIKLRYYFERHIEVDGEEHGPLSLEMITTLCDGDDAKWINVLEVAVQALTHRIRLWDAISEEIEERGNYEVSKA